MIWQRDSAIILGGLLVAAVLGVGIVDWPVQTATLGLLVGSIALISRYRIMLPVLFMVALAVPVQHDVAGIPANLADGVFILWCVCLPMLMAGDAPAFRPPTLTRTFLPFVLAASVSTIMSIDVSASVKQSFRLVEWFTLFPVLLSYIPRAELRRAITITATILAILIGSDACVETLNGQSWSGRLGIPVPLPPRSDIYTNAEGISVYYHYTFDVTGRAGSTFGGPQALAMFLVLLASVPLVGTFAERGWIRSLSVLAVIGCIVGLVTSDSRGGIGWMALEALAIWIVARRRSGASFLLMGGVVLGVSVLMIIVGLVSRDLIAMIPVDRPDAVLDRLTIWRMALRIWQDNPWFGVGMPNYRTAALAHQIALITPLPSSSLHAHNTYLEVLADGGLVGLVTFLYGMMRLGRKLASSGSLVGCGVLTGYLGFSLTEILLSGNTPFLFMLIAYAFSKEDA